MSGCQKIAYFKSEAKAAKRSCQRAAEAGADWRNESRIYRCDRCSMWHLTSMPHRDHEQAAS